MKKIIRMFDEKCAKRDISTGISNKIKFIIPLIILLFIVAVGFFIYQQEITGKLSLNLQDENLLINLKKGELLPINSKLIINQNDIIKEISISELIESNANGSFYIENKEISGEGEGYGFVGEKTSYPDVFFELQISDAGESGEETAEEVVEPEIVIEEPTGEVVEPEIVIEEPAETPAETPIEVPVETPAEKAREEPEAEQKAEEEKEPAEEPEVVVEEPTEEIAEETAIETSSIAGEVVKENDNYVEGSCSKGNPFTYEIGEGRTAEIKKESVSIEETDEKGKLKKKKIDDDAVNLQISDNYAIVSTDYSTTKQGFGGDYLGEEISLKISLEKLGITGGDFTITLAYENNVIAEVSEEISVEQPKIPVKENITGGNVTEEAPEIPENITTNITIPENITLPEEVINITIPEANLTNITIINETITNITIINETITNITIINVTLVNKTALNITTKQYKAVINRPVKWIKTIKIENLSAKDLRLELPKQAENITVKTGQEIQEALQEINEYEQIINETSRQSLITGQVTGDVSLEIKKSRGILTRFWNWLTGLTITGKIIYEEDIENIVETNDSRIIDLENIANQIQEQETEIAVEYYTDAPTAEETNISGGKRVVVSAPTELHYENVLAYTILDNRISINNTDKIKLYWVKQETIQQTAEEIQLEERAEEEQQIQENQTQPLINESVNETGLIEENQTIEQPTETEKIQPIEKIQPTETEVGENTTKQEITKEETAETEEIISNLSLITGFAISDIENNSDSNLTNSDIENNSDSNLTNTDNNSISEPEASQTQTSITKELINFTAFDLDEDGFVDYIEWEVPYLSNQTYEIIYITKAEHLDEKKIFIEEVYDRVREKDDNWTSIPSQHYVRVTFELPLTKDKDITIYARESNCSASENNSIMINGTEVPCDIYQKKKRIDEIRRLLGE